VSPDRAGEALPVAAVYRSYFLPPSETFVRDHILHMPRYRTVPVTSELLPDPLPVPGREVVLARPVQLLARGHASALRRVGRDRASQDVRLADALRRSRADLVHAHFGTDAARIRAAAGRRRLPLVATFHGYDVSMHDTELRKNPDGAWLLDTWPQLMEQAAGIITVSRFLRELLLARGAPAGKLHVIPCGVDPTLFVPEPAPDRVSLLFVGRLVEKKGVEDLLQALAGMPDAPPLDIIGDGPLRAELERSAAARRVRCTFHGVATTEQIRRAMAECTAVVMPSRRASNGDTEGLPVTALEAGASGRPVVGYSHSGISEAVVDGVTGLLAAEGDVTGLRRRLQELVADPSRARAMGARAREHVLAGFTSESSLSRVADVYDEVLATTARRG